MKGFIVLLIVLGIWLAYKRNDEFEPVVASVKKIIAPAPGARSTLSYGNGNVTNLSKSGNDSPGSGRPAVQPQLLSTWGVGGQFNIGLTGPSWSPNQ